MVSAFYVRRLLRRYGVGGCTDIGRGAHMRACTDIGRGSHLAVGVIGYFATVGVTGGEYAQHKAENDYE